MDVLDGDTSSIANLITTPGNDGAISLREAVIAANRTAGADEINLPAGDYVLSITGSGAAGGDLDITDDVTIAGAGAGQTTIDATNLGDRVLELDTWGGNSRIADVTISGGSADLGGGIRLLRGALTVVNSAISGNTASTNGGGLYVYGATTVINSTISGNTAGSAGLGGGIFTAGPLSVINSTISGNSTGSGGLGGGVWVNEGATNVTNSTFSGNSAGLGGGIANFLGTTVVNNSIITNSTGGDFTNLGGPSTGSNNLGDDDVTTGNSVPGRVGAVTNFSATLADNGGPTLTHAILAGSNAINAGNNSLLPADGFDLDGDSNTAEALPLDQRGAPRVHDTTVDIGAVERFALNYDFSAATFSTAEGDATNTSNVVMLSRDNSALAETVDVVLTGGTATAGSDFTAGPITVSFAAGESSKAVPIALLGDNTVELDETINLSLTNFSGFGQAGSTHSTAALTIENDDSTRLSIGAASVSEGDSGTTTLSMPVTLSQAVDVDVSVDYITQNGTATTADSDYVGVTTAGTLTIEAGDTTGTIDITVNGDNTVELNETLKVTLSNIRATGREAAINNSPNLVTNGNFESGNTGFASDYSFSSGNLFGEGTYDVVSSPGDSHIAYEDYGDHTSGSGLMMAVNGASDADVVWSQTITVAPNTVYDFGAWLSSAHELNPAQMAFSVNGTSIGTLAGSTTTGEWSHFFATWNSGTATSANIEIVNTNTVLDGNDFALDDIFFGEAIFSTLTNTGTITNDDSATVSISDASATEGGNLEFDVTLSKAVDVDTVITYSTANGTATTGDSDYTGQTSQTLTIAAGQTTDKITIATTGDNKVESDESLTVSLSSVSANGRDVTIGDGSGAGTIENDDSARLSIGAASVAEGDSGTTTLSFPVTLTNPVATDVSVNYATQDGTATVANSDYVGVTAGTLTIDAGETSGTIAITVNGDGKVEADETLKVNLSNIQAGGLETLINNSDNLVANGDFQAGNTGFSSDYSFSPGDLFSEGTYDLVTTPGDSHIAYEDYGDHTSGSGLMMAVNGASAADVVWSQTITVAPNTVYDFGAWLSSAHELNPAQMAFSVNGTSIGTLAGSTTTGQWSHFFATWNSGTATSANIEIVNTNTVLDGNDFAIDDIFFGEAIFSTMTNTGTITNDDSAPVFTSPTAVSVPENTTTVQTATATDADLPAETITFSISGGVDASKFSITSGGVLTFQAAPDFENPADTGSDNVYEVELTADDGSGNTTTQTVQVTVTPVNDNSPVFTSGAAVDVPENTTAVHTVTATDADLPSQSITYSLDGGADAAEFSITAGGVLTFDSAPDFENPADADGDNVYEVKVKADDGNGLTTTQTINVTVTPVNDNAPVFSSSAAVSVAEGATAVHTVTATDADLPAQTVSYSLDGGADAAKFSITSGGVLTFDTAPNFESPTDVGGDNVYEVKVKADDGNGLATTQTVLVTVTNVAPSTPVDGNAAAKTVAEGAATGTLVGVTASATDPLGPAVAYSLTDDAGGRFAINSSSGVVTVANGALLDGPASHSITVQASDGSGGTSSADFTVAVTNVDPTANADSAVTNEDQPVTINVLSNDDDAAGSLDPLSITSVTNGAHGQVTTNGTTVTYTPNSGFDGVDSFSYSIADGDGGTDTGIVTVNVKNLVDLTGRVFNDLDNDGDFEPGSGEAGLGGVTVQLFNQSSGDLIDTQITASDGTYTFDANLGAGTYRVVESQLDGLLDGDESAGTIGGSVDNSQDSNAISDIVVGEPGTTDDTSDYLFANILPSDLLGLVWEDFNNDGEVNFGEQAIEGVTVELTGNDDRGNAVSLSVTSDSDGVYTFAELRPSDANGYTISETQPATFNDGVDVLGTVNGLPVGDASVNDTFSGVVLAQPDSSAADYNFGERSAAAGEIGSGQTATIGFWQNKNGQKLIRSLNGGASSTQLSGWLAATFPNMYGADAGDNDLTGMTNAEVGDFYRGLFKRNKKSAAGGGPPKMDAQVMATALAVYATNDTLAGSAASSFGFTVTASGVGVTTVNVGSNGAAFGVADNSDVQILDLLLAVNDRSHNGLLFDLNEDGDADDSLEKVFRTIVNDVFSEINEAGDI